MVLFLSTIIVYVLSFVIAYFVLKSYQSYNGFKNVTKFKLPPCLAHLPIVGSLFLVSDLKTIHIYFMNKSKELGRIIAFYMCNKYVIILNGRQTIYEAFVKHSLNFASRTPFYTSKDHVNPKSKGIVEHPFNDEFKQYHRISLNILKKFGFGQGIMESRIRIEVEDLVQRMKTKNGQPFDPNFELTASVCNVISSIIFGKRWSIDDPELKEGIEITHSFVRGSAKAMIVNFYPILRFLPSIRKSYQHILVMSDRWDEYITKVLNRVAKDKDVESFCSIYFEEMKNVNKNVESMEKIIENEMEQFKLTIRDLFLGGTETTATTLQWFIYFMANHPNTQKKISDELNEVVGSQRLPSLEDKPNLPLMEAAILELMRIKTLIPLAVPHLTIKETIVNGIFIPKDVIVMANIYSAHMDPDIWDEPEKFKIERFLSDDGTTVINKDHVISFSLGKRSCLGELMARQELFLFTSALIHQFEILPPEGQDKIIAEEIIGATVSPTPFEARFVERC